MGRAVKVAGAVTAESPSLPGILGGLRLEVVEGSEMLKHLPEIMGISGYYSGLWKREFIEPCMRDNDSVNVIARDATGELLGYLTGGALEKYDLLHPAFGRGDCFVVVGLAVKPGEKGKGLGRALIDAAEAEAKEKGFRIWASFTTNPRLRHILDSKFRLVDSRVDIRGRNNHTYLIRPEGAFEVERELDLRPRRRIPSEEEVRLLEGLRTMPKESLAEAARAIAKRIHK